MKLMQTEFEKELTALLNRHSKENGSDTPDYILSHFLNSVLYAFNDAVNARTLWYHPGPPEEVAALVKGEEDESR